MKKLKLFYVEHHENYCSIIVAENLDEARKDVRWEFGAELNRVRPATEEDVAWCKAMGQNVPDEVYAK